MDGTVLAWLTTTVGSTIVQNNFQRQLAISQHPHQSRESRQTHRGLVQSRSFTVYKEQNWRSGQSSPYQYRLHRPSATPIPAQLGYSASSRKTRSRHRYTYAATNVATALALALPFSKSDRPGNSVTILF